MLEGAIFLVLMTQNLYCLFRWQSWSGEINDLVEEVVGALLVDFQVVHVVGRDNIYSGGALVM